MPDAIGERVAVPPKGGSYALRHEESKHRVLDRHGLTAYGEGRRPNRDGDAGGSEPFMR
jgi:hypothetical protein